MNYRQLRIAGAFAAAVFAIACSGTAGAEGAQLPDAATAFLAALEGEWQGGAVQTPAGPLPYDIRFTPDDAGCMAGVAAPGGANHRWKFCPGGGGMELEFLSDFGGNDRPLNLYLDGREENTLLFHSRSLGFLKIHALIESDCLRLKVLHHDRLHVEIHLRRPPAAGGIAESRACPWSAAMSPAT